MLAMQQSNQSQADALVSEHHKSIAAWQSCSGEAKAKYEEGGRQLWGGVEQTNKRLKSLSDWLADLSPPNQYMCSAQLAAIFDVRLVWTLIVLTDFQRM